MFTYGGANNRPESRNLDLVEIKRRKITLGDMTGLSNNGVDPNSETGYEGRLERLRRSVFNADFGS